MSKKQREQLALAFAIQDSDLDGGSFRGMASVFNTLIDTWVPTRIKPGAFMKTLQDGMQAKRIKVLYQHNHDWPIGVPTKMEENSDGLVVEAKVSQTVMGKEVLQLMRDGVLTELSIGFDPIRYEMVDEGALGQVRHISELRLWEFSPVTFGANPDAIISSVNSLLQTLRTEADVPLTPGLQGFLHAMFEQLRAVEEAEPTDLLGHVTHLLCELHEGKVLSAKNKQLVSDARDALQKLLDAAEPGEDKESLQPLTASATVEACLRSLDLLHLGARAPRAL